MPDAQHRSKRNRKPLETNRSARFQFSTIACIVVAAIVSFAAFSNVLAQQCSTIISGNSGGGNAGNSVGGGGNSVGSGGNSVGSGGNSVGGGGNSVGGGGNAGNPGAILALFAVGNSAVGNSVVVSVVPCPSQVSQGPAGVSQGAALGTLSLLTATSNATNTNIGLRLASLRGGTPAGSLSALPRGLSLATSDKQGTPLGVIGDLEQPLERGGGASADSSSLPSRFGVFANGLGTFGDQDTTPRIPGFDFHTAGFTVGGDYRFTNRFSLGTAFSYVQTNADFDFSAGNFSNKAYSLSAYGTYYILEKLYVDGIVTYGWDNYTTERNIPGTGTANGSPSGTHLAPSLSAGYNFNIGALTFGPTGRLDYVRVDIDAYREHGADPFNLSIRSQNVESLTTAFGGQATYAISTRWGVFLPLVRSEWVHEYEGNSRNVIGSFTTTPATTAAPLVSGIVYQVQTGNPDRDYFRLGGGVSATFKRGISAFVYYEAVLGLTNFTDNTFHAGVRFEF